MVRGAAPAEAGLPELLIELIGQVREYGGAEALAMLRVLAVVGPPAVRPAAARGADALADSGLTDCAWVRGLGAPESAAVSAMRTPSAPRSRWP